MTGQARRTAILDAAVAEFSSHGYHGARIERIAASGNVNKQLIFHYFGSKDGLYEAVVTELFPATSVFDGRGTTPLESVGTCIAAIAERLRANPGAALIMVECSGLVGVPAEASSAVGTWIELQANALRSVIEDGQREGVFRAGINTKVAAKVLFGALDEMATNWVLSRKRYNLISTAEPVLDVFLNGVQRKARQR